MSVDVSPVAVTRRAFCASAAGTMLVAGATLPRFAPDLASLRPAAIVYDQRSALAGELARAWPGGAGIALLGFRGDIARVWFERVARGDAPIGGVTSGHALFVVERLARGTGRSIVHRSPVDGEGRDTIWRWLLAPRGSILARDAR